MIPLKRIVLDAGHGGTDPGAVGPSGLRECDVTLALAHKIKPRLESCGYEILMTRDRDVFVPLTERTKVANQWHAQLFLSIHCNSSIITGPTGYEMWTSIGQTKSDPVADILFRQAKAVFPRDKARADWGDGDADREKHLHVCDYTICPAVLTEIGFINAPCTEVFMREDNWLDLWADVFVLSAVAWENDPRR